jgi:hypothetical protein
LAEIGRMAQVARRYRADDFARWRSLAESDYDIKQLVSQFLSGRNAHVAPLFLLTKLDVGKSGQRLCSRIFFGAK